MSKSSSLIKLIEESVNNDIRNIIRSVKTMEEMLKKNYDDDYEDIVGNILYDIADESPVTELKDERGQKLGKPDSKLKSIIKKITSSLKKLPSGNLSIFAHEIAKIYGIGERELGDGFSGWDNW